MTRYAVEHPDVGDSVLDGAGSVCRGCGAPLGVACVAFDGSLRERLWLLRKRLFPRRFPFSLDDCSVCWLRDVAINGYPHESEPERPPGWRPTAHARGRLP